MHLRNEAYSPKFYQSYVSVVYGFLAVIGLDELLKPSLLVELGTDRILLGIGALITTIHFWLVCLSSDDLSDEAYKILAGWTRPQIFNLLLIMDLLFATAFAAPILLMFRSLQSNTEWFFLSFAILTSFSLLYDIVALVLGAFAALKTANESDRNKIKEYVKTHGAWMWLDGLYIGVGWLSYWLSFHFTVVPLTYSSLFLVVCVAAISFDVILFNPSLYQSAQSSLPSAGDKEPKRIRK